MFVLISKGGESAQVSIDWDSLPQASKDYIVAYGLKQALNDCHASEKTLVLSLALVNKRLDALIKGEPPKTREFSGKDALTRELESMAAARLRSVGIKAGEAKTAVETHGWETAVRNLAKATGKDPDEAVLVVQMAAEAKVEASKSAPTQAAFTLASLFQAEVPAPVTPPTI